MGLALSACSGQAPEITADVKACAMPADTFGQFITIPAGNFIKGDQPVYSDEAPTLRLQVAAFSIQTHEVTNAQFAAFVGATGYVTDAEQGVIDGREGAGSSVFLLPEQRSEGDAPWTLVESATWKAPEGGDSTVDGKESFPVIHVSQRDAAVYADWAGGRLPTEVEWEYAASLGLPDPANPVSGAYGETGPRANTWQGIFPLANTADDGFTGSAPAGCFEPDRAGLYDMIGNVWEWTDTPYGEGTHTMKGGSYLCADNFCRRYRPAARHPQDTDFSSNHIGFRIVKDIPEGISK